MGSILDSTSEALSGSGILKVDVVVKDVLCGIDGVMGVKDVLSREVESERIERGRRSTRDIEREKEREPERENTY